jgi:hypothetical protein
VTDHYQHGESAAAIAGKLSPSIGVAGVTLAGVELQDWVLILTIIYTTLLIAEKLWKWRKAWEAERDAADE